MTRLNTKQIKRQKILDHGIQMLMTQGYHGTGINELLKTVKVPKGSFYNYFESKEEFAAEAITHYIEPFIQRLTSHLENSKINSLTALKYYYAELIDEIGKGDFKGGCLLGNLMGEISDTSKLCKQSLALAIGRYKKLQENALLQAQRDGLVRNDKTAESMANLLVNNWQGALLRMKLEQSVQPLQEFCDTLLDDYFIA